MRQDERDALLREDAPRAQTARERRQLADLDEDLRSIPLRGSPLPLRLRNFRPDAEGYLASLGGPLPYMVRLREIEAMTAAHEEALGECRFVKLIGRHRLPLLDAEWALERFPAVRPVAGVPRRGSRPAA